jgi:hypothetical protein
MARSAPERSVLSNRIGNSGPGSPGQGSFNSPGDSARTPGVSPTVFVISHDDVWARLVAKNLAARGVNVRRCLPDDISSLSAHGSDGGWMVVDTENQSSEFREFVSGVTTALRKTSVKTLAVVDSMAGHAQLVDIDADAVVSRTADMRVLVRKLLHAFNASPVERTVAALQSEW